MKSLKLNHYHNHPHNHPILSCLLQNPKMTGKITFEKATFDHREVIFSWLVELHVQEFWQELWDNIQGHKEDILNFILNFIWKGEIRLHLTVMENVFIGLHMCDGEPYSTLMTTQETHKDAINELKLSPLI